MNRKSGMSGLAAGLAVLIGLWEVSAAPPPPPGGGTVKPPDTPPPGRIYFEDHVVIVGPGFVKPEVDAGTVFVDLSKLDPDAVDPATPNPARKIERTVDELVRVKGQVESATGAIPAGLLDPASWLAGLVESDMTAGRGVFDDPAFLHEDVGGGEAAAPDRTEQARSGGVAVQAAPDAPALTPAERRRPADRVTPSYWQLPIR